MHTEERHDNGPRHEVVTAVPVYPEKRKSRMPIILAFAAGFLVALLLLGSHFAAGRFMQATRGAAGAAHVNTTGILTAITSSDVNNLRFAAADVNVIEVSTTSGRINVAFHGEDFISAHCSSSSSHSLDGGVLSLSSVSGNFTILLPENAVDSLSLRSVSGRIEVNGISRANTVFANGFNIRTTSGRINLNNLAVPGNLDVTSVSGRINISNVLSDAGNTNLSSTSGRIVAD